MPVNTLHWKPRLKRLRPTVIRVGSQGLCHHSTTPLYYNRSLQSTALWFTLHGSGNTIKSSVHDAWPGLVRRNTQEIAKPMNRYYNISTLTTHPWGLPKHAKKTMWEAGRVTSTCYYPGWMKTVKHALLYKPTPWMQRDLWGKGWDRKSCRMQTTLITDQCKSSGWRSNDLIGNEVQVEQTCFCLGGNETKKTFCTGLLMQVTCTAKRYLDCLWRRWCP